MRILSLPIGLLLLVGVSVCGCKHVHTHPQPPGVCSVADAYHWRHTPGGCPLRCYKLDHCHTSRHWLLYRYFDPRAHAYHPTTWTFMGPSAGCWCIPAGTVGEEVPPGETGGLPMPPDPRTMPQNIELTPPEPSTEELPDPQLPRRSLPPPDQNESATDAEHYGLPSSVDSAPVAFTERMGADAPARLPGTDMINIRLPGQVESTPAVELKTPVAAWQGHGVEIPLQVLGAHSTICPSGRVEKAVAVLPPMRELALPHPPADGFFSQ